jgi:hypothetical protein
MTKKVIAHFTDTHLGHRLAIGGGGEAACDRMRYDNVPGEHGACTFGVSSTTSRARVFPKSSLEEILEMTNLSKDSSRS